MVCLHHWGRARSTRIILPLIALVYLGSVSYLNTSAACWLSENHAAWPNIPFTAMYASWATAPTVDLPTLSWLVGKHRHYGELCALVHVFSTFNAEMELDQHICPRIFWSSFGAQSSPLSFSWTQNDAGSAEEPGSPAWHHPCSVVELGPDLPGFYAG